MFGVVAIDEWLTSREEEISKYVQNFNYLCILGSSQGLT